MTPVPEGCCPRCHCPLSRLARADKHTRSVRVSETERRTEITTVERRECEHCRHTFRLNRREIAPADPANATE